MSNKANLTQKKACESIAYIPLSVSTPLSLKPCIRKLPITAEICGEPELTPTPCGTYILTQNLCVRVPIEIDIKSQIGNTYPHCDGPPAPPNFNHLGPPNVVIGNKRPC